MPIFDNILYRVAMCTQKQQYVAYDGAIHPATLTSSQVDKYLYIFLKSKKA